MPLKHKFHFKVQVLGKVQGVWFRKFSFEKASELNLSGWVKNETDGSVLCEIQGSFTSCMLFISWLETGSALSDVSDIQIKQLEVEPTMEPFKILDSN